MPKPSPISERDLQQAVRRLFHNHMYILVNTFVFNWESDLFSVTKSGNAYEVEMKISKADYRKDFEKDKHQLFLSNTRGNSHHIFKSNGKYVRDKERIIGWMDERDTVLTDEQLWNEWNNQQNRNDENS